MDHAVHYRNSDGETTFEEAASLEAAVSMVERLRNDEGVSDIRVYKQVPIEFKTYYKVSVVDSSTSSAPSSAPAAPAAAPAPEAAPSTPPPGAMPLGQQSPTATPAAPSASTSSNPSEGDEDSRRGSLFSRG